MSITKVQDNLAQLIDRFETAQGSLERFYEECRSIIAETGNLIRSLHLPPLERCWEKFCRLRSPPAAAAAALPEVDQTPEVRECLTDLQELVGAPLKPIFDTIKGSLRRAGLDQTYLLVVLRLLKEVGPDAIVSERIVTGMKNAGFFSDVWPQTYITHEETREIFLWTFQSMEKYETRLFQLPRSVQDQILAQRGRVRCLFK